MEQQTLIFGFDIGIASVGWAVLDDKHILDLGIRRFDKAETDKEGEPLNLARRTARLARHRLQHRKWRLMKLARLLKREGLIDDARLFAKGLKLSENDGKATVWELRRTGLDELLTPQQWARVIYHLAKHRGFYWASKAEEAAMGKDTKGEGGKVTKGLQASEERMRKEGKNYRSAAEMLLGEFPEAQRNKDKQYDKALSRILLGEELALLFQHQRALGNPHASEDLQTKILGTGDRKSGLFWQQKPALSGENLLKMLGKCTFERNEYRAPKASFSAERHVWLTRLSNLRIIDDGRTRPLTQDERKAALQLPYEKETVKFKTLKTALKKAGLWNDAVRPAHGGGKGKDPEEQTLIKLTAWHELRKAFEKAGRKDLWQRISTPALEGNPELLDELTRVLSIYKDDDEVAEHLRNIRNLPEPEACLCALERTRFSTFSNLSLKALRRIVPLMETGLRYDEAVAQIPEYGHHSQLRPADAPRAQYLPPLYESAREKGSMKLRDDIDAPRNPVVLRALNQARKVLNALVREYGSPTSVHIEMARDLSRPLKERREIEEAQNQYRKRNEQDRAEFERDHPNAVQSDRRAFAKFQLYKEQQCKCAYSQQPLDLQRIVDDPNYVQIDHILPYSRSYDDSKNNKVLVLARENQNKGNRTPYEYLTSLPDGEQRWRAFEAWAERTHGLTKAKRNRLLRKHFDEKEASEFRARNLNDTRYICRFFKNYVENNLQFSAGADGEVSRRCVVVNGQLTAFLRARWGLVKKREGSDRHHALDAAVIAACTHGMVKRLADYARRDELKSLQEGFVDPETGEILDPAAFNRVQNLFPEPWQNFRRELLTRLNTDEAEQLRADVEPLGTYSADELARLRPLFVSCAPQRRKGGAAHKETIYAQSESMKSARLAIKKIPLTKLTKKHLANLESNENKPDCLLDPKRNQRLYAAIKARLEAHKNEKGEYDAQKAFATPLRKPDRHDQPTGPIVRSVKIAERLSGIAVRGGVAANDTMLRVDVFRKSGKFHLVPVYVHHKVTGLPNRAIVQGKDEDEWTLIDDSFEFLFSLHPGDLIRITQKGKVLLGYYVSTHRAAGTISIRAHDRAQTFGKDGEKEGIGVKTALSIEKFHVDVLGCIYPATTPEVRRGLA